MNRVVELNLGKPFFKLNVDLGATKLAFEIGLPNRIEEDSINAALKLVKTFSGFDNFTAHELIEEEGKIRKWIDSIDELRPRLYETTFTVRTLQQQFNFVLSILPFFLIFKINISYLYSLTGPLFLLVCRKRQKSL